MGRRDRNRRPARRRPAIEPRERILVLCEGKNTEPQYIDGFRRWCRNPLVEVEIARDVQGVPLTLVQKAKQQWQAARAQAKRERDDFLAYDRVWCVFDVDEHPNLAAAIDMARANGIELAISNPCFELWLVLHHRENPGLQHRHTLRAMMSEFIAGYDKGVCFDEFRAGYHDALVRAGRLTRQADEAGEPHRNPTTDVWKLTELIRGDSNPEGFAKE